MHQSQTTNWQSSEALQAAKAKLIAFFDEHPDKFYSLRYIEICTQIDTHLLRLLLNDGSIAYGRRRLNLECIEGNYRAIPKKIQKLSVERQAKRELRNLRDKAANHAIALGVPKTRAKLASMGAFCDVD